MLTTRMTLRTGIAALAITTGLIAAAGPAAAHNPIAQQSGSGSGSSGSASNSLSSDLGNTDPLNALVLIFAAPALIVICNSGSIDCAGNQTPGGPVTGP
ncbi:hypothetical protein ABZ319_17410 [Nocardia sp. NPDC005978]|uniref:hypothetical protein n=1 Tax=Nocardia sp. NPDC005978 TaxID=3156725 RepID=UPI0033B2DBC2